MSADGTHRRLAKPGAELLSHPHPAAHGVDRAQPPPIPAASEVTEGGVAMRLQGSVVPASSAATTLFPLFPSTSDARIRTLEHIEEHAIVVLDLRGRIVTWSAGAQHIHGYSAQDALGKHV